MARLVAVLDANVLYPARLRDLLLRLTIAGVFQARWTARILDECFEGISADRPDLTAAQLDRTRHLMGVAVPDALVEGYEHLIGQLELPDADDRHVWPCMRTFSSPGIWPTFRAPLAGFVCPS